MFDPEKVKKFIQSRGGKYEERLLNLKKKFEKSTIEALLEINIQKKHVDVLQASFNENKENFKSKLSKMELDIKAKEFQLQKSVVLLAEKEEMYQQELLETNKRNSKLQQEIDEIKQSNEAQKSEINSRKQLLVKENEKIITENATLKTDLEKMKSGFQDLVSMYKKEKAENSKKSKQIEELKKLLVKPTLRQSPFSPASVKQSPFANKTNEQK
eukprot:gene9020-1119_t